MSHPPGSSFFNTERSVTIMGKRSRECYLCGEKYNFCPTCSQDRMKPAWMAEFHSENCKNIWDIATRFNMQLLTKEEAMAAMEKCDLSNKDSFKDCVKRDLENIFEKDEKPASKAEKAKTREVVKQENE